MQSSNQSSGSAQHDQVQPPSGPANWRNRQNQDGQAFAPTGPSNWRSGSAQHGEAFRPRVATYAAPPPLPQPQGQEDNLAVDLFTPRTFHSYSRSPILRASMQESSRRRTVRTPPGASTQNRSGCIQFSQMISMRLVDGQEVIKLLLGTILALETNLKIGLRIVDRCHH